MKAVGDNLVIHDGGGGCSEKDEASKASRSIITKHGTFRTAKKGGEICRKGSSGINGFGSKNILYLKGFVRK